MGDSESRLLATHTVAHTKNVAAQPFPGVFVFDNEAVEIDGRMGPGRFIELPSPGPYFEVSERTIDRARDYHARNLAELTQSHPEAPASGSDQG